MSIRLIILNEIGMRQQDKKVFRVEHHNYGTDRLQKKREGI